MAGQHADRLRDGQRHSELCALGYRVIRFWNNDVIDNLDGVSKRSSPNSKNAPSPHPLPASGAREMERPAAGCFSGTEYPQLNRHQPEERHR
jgi:hypothetical protein